MMTEHVRGACCCRPSAAELADLASVLIIIAVAMAVLFAAVPVWEWATGLVSEFDAWMNAGPQPPRAAPSEPTNAKRIVFGSAIALTVFWLALAIAGQA